MNLLVARSGALRVIASPTRNRASATWLRVQIARLHDTLLRAETYGTSAPASAELRAALSAIGRGEEPSR